MFDKLYSLYENAGLTPTEVQLMAEYLDFNDGFYCSSSYEKLYNYFCQSGEMPYGIAKARTGDPDLWILEFLATYIK
jgi:hypothetical protein